MTDTITHGGRDESDWENFDIKVTISLSPALAERMREFMFRELRHIEFGAPEVIALEHNTPGLWARLLDRQENPFADLYAVADEDLLDDYRWFGEAMREWQHSSGES